MRKSHEHSSRLDPTSDPPPKKKKLLLGKKSQTASLIPIAYACSLSGPFVHDSQFMEKRQFHWSCTEEVNIPQLVGCMYNTVQHLST